MNQPQPDEERAGSDIPWPWVAAGLALVALVVVLFFIASGGDGRNEDRLPDTVAEEQAAADPEQRCASRSVHEAIRAEIFRRAAQVRGEDHETILSIAGHSSVRMEAPIVTAEDEEAGTVNCRGLLWLDLPPGIVAAGGRRTLSADLTYLVRADSDGSSELASLGNAEALVDPLSKLARLAGSEEDPMNAVGPLDPLAPLPGEEVLPDPGTAGAGPSFDCGQARTASEVAVCNDAGLASLDRQMAALFSRAFARADDEQRDLLERTRDRFLAYRDGCRTNACIANAYQGRMREIRDIMAGQWQAPR